MSPYCTKDTRLAACLEISGHILERVWNVYSTETLGKIGCESVKDAIAKGRAGKVAYFFARRPDTMELVRAYYDQRQRNIAKQPSELPDEVTPEIMVRLSCSAMMVLSEYAQLWKTAHHKFVEGGDMNETVTEWLTVTPEMDAATREKSGRGVTIDGKEYKVGDRIPVAGTVTVNAMKMVDASLPKELQKKVLLS